MKSRLTSDMANENCNVNLQSDFDIQETDNVGEMINNVNNIIGESYNSSNIENNQKSVNLNSKTKTSNCNHIEYEDVNRKRIKILSIVLSAAIIMLLILIEFI